MNARQTAALFLESARNGEGRYETLRGYRAASIAMDACATHVASLVRMSDWERASVTAEAHALLQDVHLKALRAAVAR